IAAAAPTDRARRARGRAVERVDARALRCPVDPTIGVVLSTTSQTTITPPAQPIPRDDNEKLLDKARRLGEIARELGLTKLSSTIESDTRRRLEDEKVR